MKSFLLTLLVPFAMLLTGFQAGAQELTLPTDQASIDNGAKLFKMNCKSCHKIDRPATGPALKGVTQRQSLDWLMTWIKNPEAVIKSGDAHAVEMFEEYGSYMTSFPTLTNTDKLSVLAYIEAWEPPVKDSVVVSDVPNGGGNGSADNGALDIVLIIILAVLIVVLIVLLMIAAVLKKYLSNQDLDDADDELVTQTHNITKVLTSQAFIAIASIALFVAGFLMVLKLGLYRIGVQQGYAPTQPIPFSHKIHAGDHKIDCNYCHTGVRKAKHANVPSLNICMTCHNVIKAKPGESKHIEKLHKYAAFDYKTKSYDSTKATPIQWTRVHNLPDLAYFNHAQHVVAGGRECNECHGPIEEMDGYVQKYSELTMGWCIDCHRETSIDKSNPYYERLIKFNEVHRDVEDLKVEDIGGLECSKCHY